MISWVSWVVDLTQIKGDVIWVDKVPPEQTKVNDEFPDPQPTALSRHDDEVLPTTLVLLVLVKLGSGIELTFVLPVDIKAVHVFLILLSLFIHEPNQKVNVVLSLYDVVLELAPVLSGSLTLFLGESRMKDTVSPIPETIMFLLAGKSRLLVCLFLGLEASTAPSI